LSGAPRRTNRWLVAVGGNALADPRDPSDLSRQDIHARELAGPLASLLAQGQELVIVHGNGPQVGARMIQNDAARDQVPMSSLAVCVAETQGQIGHVLALAIADDFRKRGVQRRVVALLTHVLVDRKAPEFLRPDKPIGPIYAEEPEHHPSTAFAQLAGGGWRRIVPSPRPLAALEADAVRLLIDAGSCVIAGGGGGIPLTEGPAGLQSIDAVVDKDYVAEILATAIGAAKLVVLTDVPGAALSYATPGQRFLDRMTVDEARLHLQHGEFAPGSMAPKVEACIDFIVNGGEEAAIAAISDASRAFAGTAGTRITAA
jgi:carbamate kinase